MPAHHLASEVEARRSWMEGTSARAGQQPLKSVRAPVRASVSASPILLGPGVEEIRLSWGERGARSESSVCCWRSNGRPLAPYCLLLYVLRTIRTDTA